VELALRQLAALQIRTMLLEVIAHATPASLAPFLSLTELGAEFAPRHFATLKIPTVLLELIAHAMMCLLVPLLGPLERGSLLAFHRTSRVAP